MRHEWTMLAVDGFASGEVDFGARLATSSQAVKDDFDRLVMSPIVNGADGVFLMVVGYSDRVDTGQSHAESLRIENEASKQRAESAEATVVTKLAEWLDPAPTTLEQVPNLASNVFGTGASLLYVEPISEDDRRKNRRVGFAVCRFLPDN